jgi:hypothetical protein
MTETRVWAGDKHPITWRVATTDGTIDLTGATVRLIARPLILGQETTDLACTVDADVVTHQLDGALAVGRYDLVIEVTRAGEVITYPDAATAPERLVVRADVG